MHLWLWLFLSLTANAIHLPLYSQPIGLQRRAQIGLGDNVDVVYTVQINVGGTLMPLVLDTGSSDLWAISTDCKTCNTSLPLYPHENFKSTGLSATLLYGDSTSGTHANGQIGVDDVSLAGLNGDKQYFAAIDDTNTTVTHLGATGIFGLGFPVNSFVWSRIFKAQNTLTTRAVNGKREFNLGRSRFPTLGSLYPGHIPNKRHSINSYLKRVRFPSIDSLYPALSSRQDSPSAVQQAWTQTIINSFSGAGPLLARLALSNPSPANSKLTDPTFTVSLQRNTITTDPSATVGLLSIGEYPSGYSKNSFTWTDLRLYTPDQGGLYSPTASPIQVYPIAWEIYIDDVYFDGQVLPRSKLSSSSIQLSALIDTGNSLVRGPRDVVEGILTRIGATPRGTFDCGTPHTLAFKINGQMFNVDPRDFVTQAFENNAKDCVMNVVATDPPAEGKGYKYSWSLGTPFLKSVIASFHYGNITHPVSDPPKVGFVSTVPKDADQKLKDAVAAATDDNLFVTSNPAPTGLPTAAGGSTIRVPTPSGGVAAGSGANGGDGGDGKGNGAAGLILSTQATSTLLWTGLLGTLVMWLM